MFLADEVGHQHTHIHPLLLQKPQSKFSVQCGSTSQNVCPLLRRTKSRNQALCTHGEHERGQRGEQSGVDHGQQARKVTLSRSDKEQPTRDKQGRIVSRRLFSSTNSTCEFPFHLDEVNREPLTEPKQDRPTNTGMIQAITPRCLLPNSWGRRGNVHERSGGKSLSVTYRLRVWHSFKESAPLQSMKMIVWSIVQYVGKQS